MFLNSVEFMRIYNRVNLIKAVRCPWLEVPEYEGEIGFFNHC